MPGVEIISSTFWGPGLSFCVTELGRTPILMMTPFIRMSGHVARVTSQPTLCHVSARNFRLTWCWRHVSTFTIWLGSGKSGWNWLLLTDPSITSMHRALKTCGNAMYFVVMQCIFRHGHLGMSSWTGNDLVEEFKTIVSNRKIKESKNSHSL